MSDTSNARASHQPRTRDELYELIRETSSEQVQLEDMVRLGFWPRERGLPGDPSDAVTRRGELMRRIRALATDHRRMGDPEKVLQEVRKRRMEASRQRRKETKARRIEERQQKAAAWALRQAREILFLGRGVSGGLNDRACDEARLTSQGLPVWRFPEDIAKAMGITVGELRFLAYHRPVSAVSHYVRFTVPKKTGGERLISAPMPRLKAAQRWILDHLLSGLVLHDAAHGFVPGRSICSNATPHIGAEVVVNLDLANFFPTVSYRRVKGLFGKLGFGSAVSTVLALVCTEPEVETVELDGNTWHVATSERRLPQGAPTSPALTNLICRKLDRRLAGLSAALGFQYTRYADDLTFSASGEGAFRVGVLLRALKAIIEDEGFVVHPEKTRVFRKGRRQEVTGLVVNERLSVDRRTLRRFRATLFQIEKDGPEGKTWGAPGSNLFNAIQGFADFVYMVDAEKGQALRAQVAALRAQYGMARAARPATSGVTSAPAGGSSGSQSVSGASVVASPNAEGTPATPQAADEASGGAAPASGEGGDLTDLIMQYATEEGDTPQQPAQPASEGEGDSDKEGDEEPWWKLF